MLTTVEAIEDDNSLATSSSSDGDGDDGGEATTDGVEKECGVD